MEDVIAAKTVLTNLSNVKGDSINLIGVGQTGPVVQHASVFEECFNKVVIKNSIELFIDLLETPLSEYQYPEVVPLH